MSTSVYHLSPKPPAERSHAELEAVVERGLATFVEVGTALMEIRDRRTYREAGYSDFDTYCRERWHFTGRRARQLMAAAEVVHELPSGTTVPANEAQARELRKAPPEEQAEVWEKATERAASEGRAATASDVAATRRFTPAAPGAKTVPEQIREMVETTAAPEGSRVARDPVPANPLDEVIEVLGSDGSAEGRALLIAEIRRHVGNAETEARKAWRLIARADLEEADRDEIARLIQSTKTFIFWCNDRLDRLGHDGPTRPLEKR